LYYYIGLGISALFNHKGRTIGRSFRVDERWLDILKEEAERERTSPNGLVNRILQDYCTFGRIDKNLPTVSISQKLFAQILAASPKEKLRALGKEVGAKNFQDIANILGLEPNQESIIYFVREFLSRHLNLFVCTVTYRKDRTVLHLRHYLGENWSVYISEMLYTIFDNVLNVKPKIEFSEETVTIYVPNVEPHVSHEPSWAYTRSAVPA
jgi:hypothetical protein